MQSDDSWRCLFLMQTDKVACLHEEVCKSCCGLALLPLSISHAGWHARRAPDEAATHYIALNCIHTLGKFAYLPTMQLLQGGGEGIAVSRSRGERGGGGCQGGMTERGTLRWVCVREGGGEGRKQRVPRDWSVCRVR